MHGLLFLLLLFPAAEASDCYTWYSLPALPTDGELPADGAVWLWSESPPGAAGLVDETGQVVPSTRTDHSQWQLTMLQPDAQLTATTITADWKAPSLSPYTASGPVVLTVGATRGTPVLVPPATPSLSWDPHYDDPSSVTPSWAYLEITPVEAQRDHTMYLIEVAPTSAFDEVDTHLAHDWPPRVLWGECDGPAFVSDPEPDVWVRLLMVDMDGRTARSPGVHWTNPPAPDTGDTGTPTTTGTTPSTGTDTSDTGTASTSTSTTGGGPCATGTTAPTGVLLLSALLGLRRRR